MKRILLPLFFLTSSLIVNAQVKYSIGFLEDSTIVKNPNNNFIFPIDIRAESLPPDSLKYELQIGYNIEKSTLLYNAFRLNLSSLTKKDFDNQNSTARVYIELMPDKEVDRDRFLLLDLKLKIHDKDSTTNVLKSENQAINKRIVIKIQPSKTIVQGGRFDQLAYIGTNFDLAEGRIESNNLFFAANIMKRPHTPDNKVGFYLSLYGNRALTQIDSTVRRTFRQNQILNDSTIRSVIVENDIITKRTSDNLGSYISPLIRIKHFNRSGNQNNNFALYYAPSLEFVWRRTTETFTYNEVRRDTLTFNSTPVPDRPLNQQLMPNSRDYNEFTFNAGIIGLFMVYETDNLSVRVHGSMGYSSTYIGIGSEDSRFDEYKDLFFSGRAWITESSTGITLQAEVNNAWSSPRPFFVATLSKAISFKGLGGIFKPIGGG